MPLVNESIFVRACRTIIPTCLYISIYIYIYTNIHAYTVRIYSSIDHKYLSKTQCSFTQQCHAYTGVIKHTKQTHRRIVKSARQRPEENSINPLMGSIRLANREKKKGKERKRGRKKQTNRRKHKWSGVAPVENDHWQNFYNAATTVKGGNERFARIRSVTVLQMYTSLLYFCCMCHLACYSWLNFRVPALIDTPRRRATERLLSANRCAHLSHHRFSISCPRQLDIPTWTGCRYEQR